VTGLMRSARLVGATIIALGLQLAFAAVAAACTGGSGFPLYR
jgi:hypothetical protein